MISVVQSFVYFLITAVLSSYLYLQRKYSFFKSRKIPHVKPSSWLRGNFGEVGSKLHTSDLLRQTYDELKGKGAVAGFYSMIVPMYFLTDIEVLKLVLIKDFDNFSDRGIYVNEEVEPISAHLAAISGERWKFIRQKLRPAFASGKLKTMYHTIADSGDNLTNAIDNASRSGSVDIRNISLRYTADVISSCAFGIEANTLNYQNPEIYEILITMVGHEGISQVWFFFLSAFPNFARVFNLKYFNKKVSSFFENMVGGSIRHREANNITRNDLLNVLIELKNQEPLNDEKTSTSRKLSMNDCLAQAFIFLLAGSDTSSFTISYALLELGHNHEIQERLRKEINEKTSDSNGVITYDSLQEMTYLNQVVNETLRKFPPGPFIIRKALSDYKIPNSEFVIEKDQQIMIPVSGFHYDSEYWEDPEEFNPDRFSVEESAKRPNLAFLPFGAGPRNCIGLRFGLLNVKFAIAKILKSYKVNLDKTKTQFPLKLDPKRFTIEPMGGAWISFEKL